MKASAQASARLNASFYSRKTEAVARALLGKTLVHLVNGQRLSGRIVETEAYLGVRDKAAHSFGGRRTARTESMFLPAGHAYVFLIYGLHACFNIVTGSVDVPEAVLIRALEPVEGLGQMIRRRRSKNNFDLANGPGKLCQALGIDRSLDRVSLVKSREIWLEDTPRLKNEKTFISSRVGIGYAEEAVNWPLRFSLSHPVHDHQHISKPWPCY